MQIGLLVESEEGLDWQRWRELYRRADRDGFSSIWISDHLVSPWSAERYGLDAWVALSVAAAETSRVRFGPLVSPVTFRAPALVARMAAALRDLSQDRFVLGLGLGWNAEEHSRFGLDFPSTAERARLLDQAMSRIRSLLGEPSRVPILLGGSGKRWTLPLVAAHADEWNMTTASPLAYTSALADFAHACAQAGRDLSTVRRSIACGVLVGRDTEDLLERASRLARRVPPLAAALGASPRAADSSQASAIVRAAADSLGWLVGTPAELATALAPFAASGVGEAMLGVYDFDDMPALDLIAAELVNARP